jgi:hypothetical protein
MSQFRRGTGKSLQIAEQGRGASQHHVGRITVRLENQSLGPERLGCDATEVSTILQVQLQRLKLAFPFLLVVAEGGRNQAGGYGQRGSHSGHCPEHRVQPTVARQQWKVHDKPRGGNLGRDRLAADLPEVPSNIGHPNPMRT